MKIMKNIFSKKLTILYQNNRNFTTLKFLFKEKEINLNEKMFKGKSFY